MRKIHITESQFKMIKQHLNEQERITLQNVNMTNPTEISQEARNALNGYTGNKRDVEIEIPGEKKDAYVNITDNNKDGNVSSGEEIKGLDAAKRNGLGVTISAEELGLAEGITKKQIKEARIRMLKENSLVTTKRRLNRKKY